MMLKSFGLIIFDADGTLWHRDTRQILPGVAEWFSTARRPHLAIATNQGGAGLRYWMEAAGFGDPSRYPTASQVSYWYGQLAGHLNIEQVYMCYAYQSTKGTWGPTPPHTAHPERWRHEWRKPAPGMLLQAMADYRIPPTLTLMVGDSADDEAAAQSAGCVFMWAHHFFGRAK